MSQIKPLTRSDKSKAAALSYGVAHDDRLSHRTGTRAADGDTPRLRDRVVSREVIRVGNAWWLTYGKDRDRKSRKVA